MLIHIFCMLMLMLNSVVCDHYVLFIFVLKNFKLNIWILDYIMLTFENELKVIT